MSLFLFLALPLAAVLLFYVYRLWKYSGRIQFIGNVEGVLPFLTQKDLNMYYIPHWRYGIDPKYNTFGAFTCDKINYRPTREILHGSDGGEFALDWFNISSLPELPPETPIVFMTHGISGGSHERYIQKFALRCAKQKKWRVCCLINRGCCGTKLTTCRTYNGGFTDDIHVSLKTLVARYPDAPIALAGFSLGGNQIGKYLGEVQSKNRPKMEYEHVKRGERVPENVVCAVLCGCPFDMKKTNADLSFKEQCEVGRGLFKYAERHKEILSSLPSFSSFLSLPHHPVSSFDSFITCHICSYSSPDEFYEDGSAVKYLDGISLPTLFLSSLSDPVSLSSALPLPLLSSSPSLAGLLLPGGGHLGSFSFSSTRTTLDGDMGIRMIHHYSDLWGRRKEKKKVNEKGEEEEKEKEKEKEESKKNI